MEAESFHRGWGIVLEVLRKSQNGWKLLGLLATCIYFTVPLGDDQLKDLASRDCHVNGCLKSQVSSLTDVTDAESCSFLTCVVALGIVLVVNTNLESSLSGFHRRGTGVSVN